MNMKKFIVAAVALIMGINGLSAQQVRFFAHRGGRKEFEENTLNTFKACNAKGMNGFETDVRLTSDGQFVISHDANLKRMFGADVIIEEHTLKELKTYRTKEGNELMTLDELLDFLKDKKGLYVEFEMKTTDVEAYPQEKLEKYCDKLYKAVMKAKPADATFLFTSFDVRAIRYMTGKYPDGDYLYIIGEPVSDKVIALASALNVKRIGCTIEGTSRAAVTEAHKAGLIVSLWPGNSPADFMLGVSLGADFLCSDVPLAVMEWIKQTPWIDVVY